MNDVRHPPEAGQEAASNPAGEAHAIVEALRLLAFDAAAPQGERKHTRRHLRRTLKAHFRALEVRIVRKILCPVFIIPNLNIHSPRTYCERVRTHHGKLICQ